MIPNQLVIAVFAGAALCFAQPALAQPHMDNSGPHGSPPAHGSPHGGPHGFTPHGVFPGGTPHFTFSHHNVAQFSPAEHQQWTGGQWHHVWHHGHFGWWWFVGGFWYFYDVPIYPYPDYVSDDYYDDDYGPGGQTWYYCSDPQGYYPYVQNCSVPWQPVPVTPPGYVQPSGSQYDGSPDQGPGSWDSNEGPPPGDQGPGSPPADYQGRDNGPGVQPPSDYPPGSPPPGSQPPPPSGYDGPSGPN